MDLNCLTLMIFRLKEKIQIMQTTKKYVQLILESKELFFTVEKSDMHGILATVYNKVKVIVPFYNNVM